MLVDRTGCDLVQLPRPALEVDADGEHLDTLCLGGLRLLEGFTHVHVGQAVRHDDHDVGRVVTVTVVRLEHVTAKFAANIDHGSQWVMIMYSLGGHLLCKQVHNTQLRSS